MPRLHRTVMHPIRTVLPLALSTVLAAQGPQPPQPSGGDPLLYIWLLGAEVHGGMGTGLGSVHGQAPRNFGFTWNIIRYLQPDLPGTLQLSPLLERSRSWMTLSDGKQPVEATMIGSTLGLEARWYLPATLSLWNRQANWFITASAGRYNWELEADDPRPWYAAKPRTSGTGRAYTAGLGFTWSRQASLSLKARREDFLHLGHKEVAPWVGLNLHLWLLPPRK